MRRATIPVQELFAWGKLNGVAFDHVEIQTNINSTDADLKGAGLIITGDCSDDEDAAVLMSVPEDLILSREQVIRYAALDKHLKSVLDAAEDFGRVSRST